MSSILIPIILGTLSVIQNGLNRNIGLSYGLSTAVLMNVGFATLVSFAFWYVARNFLGQELGWVSGSISIGQLRPWHFLPGFFGFLIVLGIPFAINQLGATRVFVGFVAAQILTSLLWDVLIANTPIVATRVLGAILTVAGVLLVSLR